jgi:hypothetical protein
VCGRAPGSGSSRSATDVKAPRRMRLVVILAKKRSTRLNQEALVGVKCILKRGCFLSQACTSGDLVGRVVIAHQVHIEIGQDGRR